MSVLTGTKLLAIDVTLQNIYCVWDYLLNDNGGVAMFYISTQTTFT